MNGLPILFFDSGVGGIPYLLKCREELKGEEFIYLADNRNFPYGSRGAEDIRRLVLRLIEKAHSRFGFKMIVLSCNTASITALDTLRREWPDTPIVGVVPAIKPAARISRNRRIALLATRRTIEEEYIDRLIADHASECAIIKIAASPLVKAVEELYFDQTKREEFLSVVEDQSRRVRQAGVDTVILGCTHFLHCRDMLGETLGAGITVVDSVEGICKRIFSLLKSHGLFNVGSEHGKATLSLTGSTSAIWKRIADIHLFDEQLKTRL